VIKFYTYTNQSRRKNPRTLPGREGGWRMLRGLMLRMEFFSSFLMFYKHLWRYSCIMKSTGSVVIYLIFEFPFQHVWLIRYRPHVRIMHILCMKIDCYFLLNIKARGLTVTVAFFGVGANTTMKPRGGSSVRPRGKGAGASLRPTGGLWEAPGGLQLSSAGSDTNC